MWSLYLRYEYVFAGVRVYAIGVGRVGRWVQFNAFDGNPIAVDNIHVEKGTVSEFTRITMSDYLNTGTSGVCLIQYICKTYLKVMSLRTIFLQSVAMKNLGLLAMVSVLADCVRFIDRKYSVR